MHHARAQVSRLDIMPGHAEGSTVSRFMIGFCARESLEIEIGRNPGLCLAERGKCDILWHTARRRFDGAGE